jgi:RNA polymerase sigma-70 factor (ECF subfamily)
MSPDETVSLVEASRRGEGWAQEEVMRLIRSFARYLCRGRSTSAEPEPEWEDVAQEAARRFFTSGLAHFKTGGPERSYVYTIVKAARIQIYRSMSRRSRRESAAAREDVTPPPAETRTLLFRVLSRIPDTCRELLERVFFDGSSHAELAQELGLAESSVRSRLTRCLQRAREVVS